MKTLLNHILVDKHLCMCYNPYIHISSNKIEGVYIMQTQFKNTLYGDGIHDDLPAIQEMLDSGVRCVTLPLPKVKYIISSAINIHSNQELRLDRYALISLKDGANSLMIRTGFDGDVCRNVKISGGIWDMNHNNQNPNPWHFPNPATGKKSYDVLAERGIHPAIAPLPENAYVADNQDFPEDVYTGHCMVFKNTKNFYIGNLTIRNPVVYGMDLYRVEDFTVENIDFDYTEGSPKLWNMDGVHIEGYCKNGFIHNLKGACHDDTVALTSDDSFFNGPIENVTVDGIYGENSHSGVRLLSRTYPVRNVHITNVYGSYYAYAVVLSKYSELPERSGFENINIDNVFVRLCPGTVDVAGNRRPLIWIGEDIDVKNLTVSNLHRNETHNPNPTIGIYKGSSVSNLSVANCTQTNSTEGEMPFIHNEGTIKKLYAYNVETDDDVFIKNDGVVEKETVM